MSLGNASEIIKIYLLIMAKQEPRYAVMRECDNIPCCLLWVVPRMLVIYKRITNVHIRDILLQVEQLKVLLHWAKATSLLDSFLEYLMYCSKIIAAKIKEISLSFNVNAPLRLVTFPHISYLLLTYLYKIFLFLTKNCFFGNVILVYWYEQEKYISFKKYFPLLLSMKVSHR